MVQLILALVLSAADEGMASEKDYKIVSEGTTTKLKAGANGKLVIQVVPQNGFKVSDETPFSLKLAATDGVKLDGTQFQRKDLVDPKAKDPQVKTGFRAEKKGEHTVSGDLVFFLCTEKLCQRMTAKTSVKIAVD